MASSKPHADFSNDAYRWDNQTGWRANRNLRPFRGMYHDVRRRLPYYASDWRDGLNYRTFAGTVRIFFVNLLPALAFLLDLQRNTDYFFGVNEALFSSALAAVVFSLLSVQPLTVVGITGLISLFNYTIFDITVAQGVAHLYPQILSWVSIWAAITHWICAINNWCDYMRYITDFSSQSFGMYVGIIYMIKGVEELIDQFESANPRSGYLSAVIALSYWFTVYKLEDIGSSVTMKPWIRAALSDFAYPLATIWWTGFSHIPGRILDADLLRVPITRAFYPSTDRPWLIDFWNLEAKWVLVSLPIGILMTMLFYYDHNVSSLTAQAKQFPLTKPAGFHWDFFLLGCTCFIAGILAIPLPNGLVPQAPVHTEACTDYVASLRVTTETAEDDDSVELHNRKITTAVDVKEQRVSHFLMALAFIATMSPPLLHVLHSMPRALFCGVFFVVGWGSIGGNGMTDNFLFALRERRFVHPGDPRSRLRRHRILLYIAFQVVGVVVTVAVSQTIAAIGFPVLIMALIPLRWVILPRVFTVEELHALDAPTATADVVLVSLGGQPERPEVKRHRRKMGPAGPADEEARVQAGSSGANSGANSVATTEGGLRSRDAEKDEKRG